MHRSVVEAWHAFSEPFEGRVHWLYADVKGLITAGVGNLADPVSLAQAMPWVVNGVPVDKAEIARQWHAVKEHAAYLSKRHYKFAANYTTMRLTDEGIDQFVARRLAISEVAIRKHFPGWDSFPADAQLGCLSMAWAVGDGFPAIFKNFTRAANAGDWSGALAACKIKESGNPGVVPRNRANRRCFANAAVSVAHGLDAAELYWPGEAKPAERPPARAIDAADRARATAFFADFARSTTADGVHEALREMADTLAELELRYGPSGDDDDEDETATLPPPAPDTERPSS